MEMMAPDGTPALSNLKTAVPTASCEDSVAAHESEALQTWRRCKTVVCFLTIYSVNRSCIVLSSLMLNNA